MLPIVAAVMAVSLLAARPAFAQAGDSPGASPVAAAASGTVQMLDDEDDPAVLDPAEPDFVVINVPTNLRLPRYKSNFRLTHRFAGNLRSGTFSQNAANLFGLDQGAIIGFEFRMNVARRVQVSAFRTNFDRTIQLHGAYDVVRQRGAMPVSITALASIEGTNNFQEDYAPAVGAVVSHKLGTRIALYAAPIWVGHTNASLAPIDHDHDHEGGEGEEHDDAPPHERANTLIVGLGARARLTSTVYVVGEVTPRVDGYAPGEVEYGFGVEKRVGGHAFALTFTNTFGTTFSQLARGGNANALYLGFNLGRKFF